MLCQLFQTAPDAVPDTAWVYTLCCGDLSYSHAQIIPGIDPLGLLLRQSHHSGIKLLPQLLFLQKHFRLRTPLCKISSTGEIEQRFRLN